MNSEEVCRVCLSASDGLKSLHAKLYGKNKTIVETINFVVNINMQLGKGLPNKICSDCESKLTIADVFKQGCLESEAILGQHVHIKKEKCYEELPTVLSNTKQEPAEYPKKICLSSVADNSTDLSEMKTEDLITSSPSEKDPGNYVIKVELEEIHDHDETTSESHDQENYAEELENETEQDSRTVFTNSEKLISMKKDYDTKHLGTHDPSMKRISTNVYPCKTCNREFKVKSNLTKHIQNGNCSQYTSTGCEKSFLDQEILETHEAQHIKGAPTPKRSKFDDSNQKVFFLEIENPESNYSTATTTNSEEDVSLSTDKNEKLTHKVKLDINKGKEEINYKTITEDRNLDRHVRSNTGEKPYSCNMCDKNFSRKSNLDVHVRSHTGEKPYFCNDCDKKFSQKSHLNVHVRVHTGEKPYFCNICDKKFASKSYLDKHIKLHRGEKAYSCEVCDKKFSQKCTLDRHVLLHTGEKPYFCNDCDKTFSQKGHLDIHLRVHTGEKPYFCNVCDKKFSHKINLDRHLRLHRDEKPYFCNVCYKKFSQKGNLDRHVMLHTADKP